MGYMNDEFDKLDKFHKRAERALSYLDPKYVSFLNNFSSNNIKIKNIA